MDAICNENNAHKMQILDDTFLDYFTTTSKTYTLSMESVNRLYELGISCLDLIEWIKTKKHILSYSVYTRIIMRFYQIKPQFRCEKLLMLFMVHYIFRKK